MSHDAHSHGHDAHGHDSHGTPHDGGHGDDGRLQAAPNPPPRGAQDSPNRAVPSPTPSHGREALRGGDGILRPISESEYFSATPEAEAIVGSHIDEYFNQPLDIFPFWESDLCIHFLIFGSPTIRSIGTDAVRVLNLVRELKKCP